MVDKIIKKEGRGRVILLVVSLLILISAAILIGKVSLTGRVVDEKEYTRIAINENFSESTEYELDLDKNITALLLSGKIVGQGSVKVYLDDLLILDSSQLQKSGISSITGMAIEETSEEIVLTTEPTEIIEANVSQAFGEETEEIAENISIESEDVIEKIPLSEENLT